MEVQASLLPSFLSRVPPETHCLGSCGCSRPQARGCRKEGTREPGWGAGRELWSPAPECPALGGLASGTNSPDVCDGPTGLPCTGLRGTGLAVPTCPGVLPARGDSSTRNRRTNFPLKTRIRHASHSAVINHGRLILTRVTTSRGGEISGSSLLHFLSLGLAAKGTLIFQIILQ